MSIEGRCKAVAHNSICPVCETGKANVNMMCPDGCEGLILACSVCATATKLFKLWVGEGAFWCGCCKRFKKGESFGGTANRCKSCYEMCSAFHNCITEPILKMI